MLNNGILANSKQCKSPPITVFEYSPSLHRAVTVTKAGLGSPILESPVHVKQLANFLPKQFREKSGKKGKAGTRPWVQFLAQDSGECGNCPSVAVHGEGVTLPEAWDSLFPWLLKSHLFDTTITDPSLRVQCWSDCILRFETGSYSQGLRGPFWGKKKRMSCQLFAEVCSTVLGLETGWDLQVPILPS